MFIVEIIFGLMGCCIIWGKDLVGWDFFFVLKLYLDFFDENDEIFLNSLENLFFGGFLGVNFGKDGIILFGSFLYLFILFLIFFSFEILFDFKI